MQRTPLILPWKPCLSAETTFANFGSAAFLIFRRLKAMGWIVPLRLQPCLPWHADGMNQKWLSKTKYRKVRMHLKSFIPSWATCRMKNSGSCCLTKQTRSSKKWRYPKAEFPEPLLILRRFSRFVLSSMPLQLSCGTTIRVALLYPAKPTLKSPGRSRIAAHFPMWLSWITSSSEMTGFIPLLMKELGRNNAPGNRGFYLHSWLMAHSTNYSLVQNVRKPAFRVFIRIWVIVHTIGVFIDNEQTNILNMREFYNKK